MTAEPEADVARQCWAALPRAVRDKVRSLTRVHDDLARYAAMSDADLHRATVVCLSNLGRLDDESHSVDFDLRAVLVPELWHRLADRAETRTVLRRLTTTIAEYHGDRPSVFKCLMGADRIAQLRARGEAVRQQVATAARLDLPALVEATRFAVARSRVIDAWAPCDVVYEPGFTYRLVPVLVDRVAHRLPSLSLQETSP